MVLVGVGVACCARSGFSRVGGQAPWGVSVIPSPRRVVGGMVCCDWVREGRDQSSGAITPNQVRGS